MSNKPLNVHLYRAPSQIMLLIFFTVST